MIRVHRNMSLKDLYILFGNLKNAFTQLLRVKVLIERITSRSVFHIKLISLLLLFLSTSSVAAVWSITYPKSPIEDDSRYTYPLALLELTLQKTGVRYELKPSVLPMRQTKALKRLEENLEVNVFWTMTDMQREEQLRPIRIPLAKGLIGWRVFLTHKDNSFKQESINTFSDLLEFSPVQGIAWPDTKILQANGFNVVTSRDYIEATTMLNNQLADFFPRSVTEVLDELDNNYSNNFVIKKGVLIHYPTALYFFTNKRNVTLSRLIETGLNMAIEDGSFDELFNKHYGEIISKLEVETSKQFELANPLLPEKTPISEALYWYKPLSKISP